jgi:hypothetical protein
MENLKKIDKAKYKLLDKCELRGYLTYLNQLSNHVISSNLSVSELLTNEIAINRLRGEIIKVLQWNQKQV